MHINRRWLARVPGIGAVAAGVIAASACGSLVPITAFAPPTPTPACSKPGPVNQTDSFSDSAPLFSLSGGLQYGDLRVGCGALASRGKNVAVEYTGWLQQAGQKFDSSRGPGRQPFVFPVGLGQVIPGFDQGVLGMHVGGKRRLVIPPALGYGASGFPPVIPPNATLVFDVELIAVQ